MKQTNAKFLVNAKWLSEHLQDDNLVIIDCQWDTNAYLKAHIPGALMRPGHPYVKSEQDGVPSKYLPTAKEFLAMMEGLGIGNDTQVVCYDEWDNHFATRLWWVMTYYGHSSVRLLDGGWQAWVSSGFPISFVSHKARTHKKPFVIKESTSSNVTMDEVVTNHQNVNWQILDVRSEEEFEGKDLADNQRGGHISGAIHLEWKKLLVPSEQFEGVNQFQSEKEIQSLLKNAGVDSEKTIVVHCQSGVRASFTVFCLEMLGHPKVKLYDGSMGEWANVDHTVLEI